MHGAAQAFGHARAIGAAKSVSLKKIDRVRFKINFQKVLKLKKNLHRLDHLGRLVDSNRLALARGSSQAVVFTVYF